MFAWFALIIPLLTAAVLWLFWQRRVTWWELLIPMGVSIVLIFSARWITEYAQTADTEYWTGWVVRADYYEHWNEMVTRTETYTVTVGSGKNAHTETRTRIVHEVVDHPATWHVIDSNGISVSVSSSQFEQLAQKFKSRKFVSMFRSFHTINGNKYEAHWPGNDDTFEVVTTTHTYENRIQASDSIYRFRKPDKQEKEQYGLFDYPAIKGYHCPSILGISDPVAERKLSMLNAKLGKKKQIRVWVLVFKDQPLDAAMSQMNHWEGGNKNELVLTASVDSDNNVQWGYVFSWTEREALKVQARDLITEQKKLNLSEVVDKLEPLVQEGWERKHFKDFNYLSVEPPWWSTFLIFVLTLATNVGLSFWFIRASGGGRYYGRFGRG